jgi:hypothetical protein
MKLIRMGEAGREKPGVLLEDGTRVDVSGFGADYDEAFFAAAELANCGIGWRRTAVRRRAFHPRYVWGRRFAGRARSCVPG